MYVVHVAAGLDPVSVAHLFARQQTFQSNRRRGVNKCDQINIIYQLVAPAVEGTCQDPPGVPLLLTDEADAFFRSTLRGEGRICRHPIEVIDVEMPDAKLMREPPAQSRHA